MKIGIKISRQYITLPFFINLYKYLEKLGNDVYFINPDFYTKYILDKYSCRYILYSKKRINRGVMDNKSDLKLTKNSAIFKLNQRLLKFVSDNVLLKKINIDLLNSYFNLKDENFDLILFWNGISDVESYLSKKLNFKTYFFENGYIEDYIQLDSQGVNSNTSFSNLSYEQLLNFKYPKLELSHINFNIEEIKIKYYFIFIINFFLKNPLFSFSELLLAIKYFYYPFKFKKKSEDLLTEDELNKNYYFLPLQVNSDTQIIINSKFNSMYEVLDLILDNSFRFIIKQHPFELEKVDYLRYKSDKVIILKKYDIKKLIRKSYGVITVNSSVGFQAIMENKPVLLLGNSFYKSAPIALCYNFNLTSKQNLDLFKKLKIDKNKTKKYINKFKKDIFIKGSWKNLDINFLHSISERILTETKKFK